MSGKDKCYNNAAAEILFKTIKTEFQENSWRTRRDTEAAQLSNCSGIKPGHVQYIKQNGIT